ncbi:hypothetical protein HUG10_07485 [Halorarum halophilum]|uniref:Agl cluster protein AglQ n=1 Tax=Halorarum halophilum TaxID=2743090 RepID=A0A7D5KWY0_9EURY|nr:hypothetical protein [Halobaculum halophilum]QLG27398.1 hypothetical protein HUG10_07485 [Halobaculum halophilum]
MVDQGGRNKTPKSIFELLEICASNVIESQNADGSFPPGRNYTYNELETPVKTTARWLITFSKVYELTGEEQYRDVALRSIDYFLQEIDRPGGYTFHCRTTPGKDKCNGLVGQSWPILALSYSGRVFDIPSAIDLAIELFSTHPFHEDLGLWERIETDGQRIGFDRTLNHQILFAARSSNLSNQSAEVEEKIDRFIDRLGQNMRLNQEGLIKHFVRPTPKEIVTQFLSNPKYYPLIINEMAYPFRTHSTKRNKIERGYHTVNLAPLSKLYRRHSCQSFWESNKCANAIQYLENNIEGLLNKENTQHGDGLPGISIAKTLYNFDRCDENLVRDMVNEELTRRFSYDKLRFEIGGMHQNDQSSLISELVDLPEVHIY